MKSTLSDNKQLFNVKALAAAGLTPEAIPEGQFAVVDEATNLTVAVTDYASLPDKFRFISKLGGKVYYSFDVIDKNFYNSVAKAYQAEAVNTWETTITKCGGKGSELLINIDEQSLIQRDGLTWTHRDFVIGVTPEDINYTCDGVHPVHENNLITAAFVEKINAINSPFYEAEATVDVSGLTAYADLAALNTAVPTPSQGDMAIITGTGTVMWDGSAWQTVATEVGVISDATTFSANNNGDTGSLLKLVLMGKVQTAGLYKDLEANYVYPRGVRLNPIIHVFGEPAIQFTETQELQYEIGAGYDLRAEEFASMSLFTNLNFYPQLSDGLAAPDLVYQFENNTNYNTVSFEFASKKSGLEDVPEGATKKFAVLLATSDATIFSKLSAAFVH